MEGVGERRYKKTSHKISTYRDNTSTLITCHLSNKPVLDSFENGFPISCTTEEIPILIPFASNNTENYLENRMTEILARNIK